MGTRHLEVRGVPSLSEHLLTAVVGYAGAKAEVFKRTKAVFVLSQLTGSSPNE